MFCSVDLGTSESFNLFYDRFNEVIEGACSKVVRRSSDCFDDLVQDVYLRLMDENWRQLKAYKPKLAPEATFLFGVARNCAIDSMRKMSERAMEDPYRDAGICGMTDQGPGGAAMAQLEEDCAYYQISIG